MDADADQELEHLELHAVPDVIVASVDTCGWSCALYGCRRAPHGADELNVDQALIELERPGAQACKGCGVAAALLLLLGAERESGDTA
ncbi:DUF6233 domain-containing protein [Streptomyces luteolus]|uniref:Uncharacterized protein n=1 Tax=Streptomyces luteolus TaxID=3043615 RepID=A0ABT6TBE3_9ACTN|nr:DUF6233 domain-containing protein [Streptomyces sp. B-S-A12]MDI3424329.1 hypothetical protein [Streptomyces sp. B-S-A12]